MSYYSKLTQMAKTGEDKVIMDCACGGGRGLKHLRTLKPKELIGADISSKFLNRCIKENEQMLLEDSPFTKLMVADVRDLKYKDYFDYFYCCETLEYLKPEDNTQAMKSIVQAIKPKGKLLISVPGHEDSIENTNHLQVFTSDILKELFGRACVLLKEDTWIKYPSHETKGHHHNILMVFQKREKRGVVQKPRPMIKFVMNKFRDIPLIGAEIGVKAGKNAYSMLTYLNMECLYLIDSW